MKTSQVFAESGQRIINQLSIADGFFTRLVGLLSHDSLSTDEGLLITQCKQVHTFFMRFPIDVLFLDKSKKVIGKETLKPWRVSKIHFKADSVIEIQAGLAEKLGIKVGDKLGVPPC